MCKNIKLYVDDLRDIPAGYVGARTIKEAIDFLENPAYMITHLSLDHDMGEDVNGNLLATGQDLVRTIGERGLYAQKIYIHTQNSYGRSAMFSSLESFKRHGLIKEDIELYNYSITPDTYTEPDNK